MYQSKVISRRRLSHKEARFPTDLAPCARIMIVPIRIFIECFRFIKRCLHEKLFRERSRRLGFVSTRLLEHRHMTRLSVTQYKINNNIMFVFVVASIYRCDQFESRKKLNCEKSVSRRFFQIQIYKIRRVHDSRFKNNFKRSEFVQS